MLVGKVNRDIVSAINVHGPLAVGMSGEDAKLITAAQTGPATWQVSPGPIAGRTVAVGAAIALPPHLGVPRITQRRTGDTGAAHAATAASSRSSALEPLLFDERRAPRHRVGGKNADYGDAHAVEANRFADDGRIGAEGMHPDAMTEDYDLRKVELFVGLGEVAADGGSDAERLEEISGDDADENLFGAIAGECKLFVARLVLEESNSFCTVVLSPFLISIERESGNPVAVPFMPFTMGWDS